MTNELTVSRDALICDGCGHTALEHFDPEHGYEGCKAGGCTCDWFTVDFATWDASR